MGNNKGSDWYNFYDKAFRKDTHQLLAWGYEDIRLQINSSLLEEQITGLIIEGILKRLDDPKTPSKYRRYDVREEDYVRGGNSQGRDRQRLDIVIVCSAVLPRPTFIFEAKLLRKNGFPIGKYTGDGGMQCFIRGEYAADNHCAAMIGYIQSDNAYRWAKELQRSFNNDTHGILKIKQSLQQCLVIPELPSEWLSIHERENNDNIEIHHIFLDCT
jgi:hypothetical protein